jgi:hypothetical protein
MDRVFRKRQLREARRKQVVGITIEAGPRSRRDTSENDDR